MNYEVYSPANQKPSASRLPSQSFVTFVHAERLVIICSLFLCEDPVPPVCGLFKNPKKHRNFPQKAAKNRNFPQKTGIKPLPELEIRHGPVSPIANPLLPFAAPRNRVPKGAIQRKSRF